MWLECFKPGPKNSTHKTLHAKIADAEPGRYCNCLEKQHNSSCLLSQPYDLGPAGMEAYYVGLALGLTNRGHVLGRIWFLKIGPHKNGGGEGSPLSLM